MASETTECEDKMPPTEGISADSASPSVDVDVDENFFTAFKKLKVDAQWSEESLLNDVSTEALRDLWTGTNSKTKSRSKHHVSKWRKKHRHSSKQPYTVDNLPCMDKLTLSKEKCSCSSCSLRCNENLFGLSSSVEVESKSLIREARLKLHHSEKDRKNVICKAKLNLHQQVARSPSGAKALIPDIIFGAKSRHTPTFDDVKSSLATTSGMTSEFETAPVFSDHHEENCDSVGEVIASQKRREPRLHRTCSQEAKLDEMTVDELAGYLEEFVHLPKKMSEMAEMMYT